jgi:hypothetical protein
MFINMDFHVYRFIHTTSTYRISRGGKILFNQYVRRSNVIGIVKLRDFALITPEQYHLTVKHMMEFHTRM